MRANLNENYGSNTALPYQYRTTEAKMPGDFLQFSVYLNPQRDKDLIGWLRAQKNTSAAIREILQRHLSQGSGAVQAEINPEALQKAVEAGIDARLSDIRRIVDAALFTAQRPASAASSEDSEDEPEDDMDWLDALILD
jgi:hypothetical protein